MAPELIVPIALFMLLAFVLAMFFRRGVRTAGDWRADAHFRSQISDIARYADAALGELLPLADEVRRRRAEGELLLPEIEKATTVIQQCLDATATIDVDPLRAPVRAALVRDLERADRAIELIRHGATILGSATHRHSEGETSVKRGYLNLLHAREGIRARVAEAQATYSRAAVSSWRR